MSSSTTTSAPASSSTGSTGGGSGGGGPTSSPLLFFVALGFGVVFTNLWIIVGVKYCFRYNQRNRRQQADENGEPIDMTAMPRTHRRRREKKLMTMEEVNERFPLTKYKAWMCTRAEEGLPTAGGVAAPHSPAPSVRDMDGAATKERDTRASGDKERPITPSSSAPQRTDTPESPTQEPTKSPEIHDNPKPNENEAATTKPPNDPHTTDSPQKPQDSESTPQSPPALPTRQEVHADNNMDDDDEIQIAVPTELLANPGDSCAICIDTLEDDDDVRGLTCGHAFHASCLDPWLTSRRACCPLCKADYYVPKPRPEGEAAAEADRHAGRRPPGMSGARIDNMNSPAYTFVNRREGRARMILPGRFMTIGHFDQSSRYGFPTVQRTQAAPRREFRGPENRAQSNTWRSRIPTLSVPRPSLPGRFRRNNNNDSEGTGMNRSPETGNPTQNVTPGQLESGRPS
ncbi:MAG: hypothetical protein Q9190_004041 [Brigantiaea leucoxantha]